MNLYFYHQRSDFKRIRKRKDNFIVSFLRISISLIEVLHHHPRHSTWDIQTIQELSKLNVLLLSKGVFPNYRLKLFCRFSAKFSHLIHYFLKICDRTYLPAIFFRFSLAKTKVHYSAKKNCSPENERLLQPFLFKTLHHLWHFENIFKRKIGWRMKAIPAVSNVKTSQIFLVLAILVNLLKI